MAEGMSKSERVYMKLREGILQGKYTPGYRFVLDRIAREEGVSPVPVREAVRLLEAEGLVTFQRNVGAVVSAIDKHVYAETMETVAVLEGYATALAAAHITEDDLAEAQNVNDRMRHRLTSAFDPREVTLLNKQFHRIITSACPTQRMLDILEREWDRITFIRRSQFAFDPVHSIRSVDEHDAIIQAMRERDADQIEQLARQHKMRTLRQYLATDHSQA